MKKRWELTEEEKKHRVVNGPLYSAVDFIVRLFHVFSLVELKKTGVLHFWPKSESEDIRRIANRAIDSFIVLKWIFLIAIWFFNVTAWPVVMLAILLLVMNLHTYFWYHLWKIESGSVVSGVEFRERRRFINLVFAISYSMALYGYLYHRVLPEGFDWTSKAAPWLAALIFSIGNSLTGFSGDLKPVSPLAQIVVVSQLLMTFVFVAMLLSNSVPRTRQ